MAKGVVAILSDFGLQDSYVAQMKAVILSRAGLDTVLVDITHDIEPGDVVSAAYHLESAFERFPRSTVFLCVVDPGVGTNRDAVAIRVDGKYFVGPDNGLFGFLNQFKPDLVVSIDAKRIADGVISNTFHGRDVFAPAAAHIADGRPVLRIGTMRQERLIEPDVPMPRLDTEQILAHVLLSDRFGNIITTLTQSDMPKGKVIIAVYVAGHRIEAGRTFADVEEGEFVALWGSSGRLEICKNRGSAWDELDVERFDEIKVEVN